jgi:hypothetical protein
LPKKKIRKEPEAPPAKKTGKMVDSFINLIDHFVAYFELLLVYARKIVTEKLQLSFIVFIALLYALFIKAAGTVLLIASAYFYILKYLNGDHILTSLVLGLGLIFFSFLLIVFLIRKIIF